MATGKRSANGLLLLGVLTLSACGTQPSAVKTPAPAAPAAGNSTRSSRGSLGVYQLSLTGSGSSINRASVSRVGGLRAQSAEASGLTFKSNTHGSYIDSATGTLRMWATFDVTNNTGQNIALPTFVPVDTDGTDGTIGTTAFKNVKYFDGSDASDKAAALGFAESTDPKTLVKTPLVTNLDTGDIQVALNAGQTLAGTARSGWQMSQLAAGATAPVTLATSVPVASTPTQNPFAFDLVFTVADSVPTTTITNIGTVQGRTPAGDAAAALTGTQTVEGVVTAIESGLGGFFVQEEGINNDKDDTTSDGIFVYCKTTCPTDLAAGSAVRVTGTVSEYGGATQLTPTTTTVLHTGLAVPAAVSLTLPLDKTQLERYEGMRVTFPETLTVTNNYTYGRYGQLDLSNAGRQFISTNGNASGTAQSTITLDDGQSAQNPLDLPYLSSQNTRRTGDTVTGLTGIWHTVAQTPMLEPEGAVNFTDANPRPAQPKDVGGSLRVGGANVLNYFTDLDSNYSGVNRGANTAAELQRQRTKMATTLTMLNPDVLALMEVENNGDTALNDIVAVLNEKAGAGTYAAVSTGKVGTDAIHVAIIYKPSKVTPIGAPMIDTSSVYSRPPVAQTFRDRGTNGVFTVVANHLKSKGSCPTSGDVDTGQGCWNQLRVQQATQLLNFVTTIKQRSGDQDVILLGDFNAYGAEDPIKTLQGGGFESLNLRIPAEDRYSYQFGGQFGYLDHALASQNLSSQVTGITEWHVNSDEPVLADYNTEYKAITECVKGAGGNANTCQGKDLYDPANPFRASDHDPVLVGLNLTPDAGTTPANPATSLSANPAALTVTAGGAAASSVLTTSTQNDQGADLSVTTSNAAGLTVVPSATTVSPNGTFTVNVTAPAGTAAGTYPVAVITTGENGLSATTTLNVTVTAGSTSSANHLVISQVFGAGGNAGATYTNDFIEIFNPTANTVNLASYSVQYASAAGNSWQVTLLTNFNLAPGQFYLVQQAKGSGGTAPLAFDASGTVAMSGAAGQVALAEKTTAISGTGDSALRDYVAYSGLSSTTSASRTNLCADTDAASDFASGAVNPRSSKTPLAGCPTN